MWRRWRSFVARDAHFVAWGLDGPDGLTVLEAPGKKSGAPSTQFVAWDAQLEVKKPLPIACHPARSLWRHGCSLWRGMRFERFAVLEGSVDSMALVAQFCGVRCAF
jgi:hypothetical protein